MELPDELIDTILSYIEPLDELKFASTCRRFNPRRQILYTKLLPIVYNDVDCCEDFRRALKANHQLGIRYMLNYVDPNCGLILALKFQHNPSIDYLSQELAIMGYSIDAKVVYYAYKVRREDILPRIECYIRSEGSYIRLETDYDVDKYYGLIASGRRYLTFGWKLSEYQIASYYHLAYRFNIVKFNEGFACRRYWGASPTRTYKIARDIIIKGENAHLKPCLDYIDKKTLGSYFHLIAKYGSLYDVARAHKNLEALSILHSVNFKHKVPERFIKKKKVIGDGFKPGDNAVEYACARPSTFRILEYLVQLAPDKRKELMVKRMENWDGHRGVEKDIINLYIKYPEAKEYAKEYDIEFLFIPKRGYEPESQVTDWKVEAIKKLRAELDEWQSLVGP